MKHIKCLLAIELAVWALGMLSVLPISHAPIPRTAKISISTATRGQVADDGVETHGKKGKRSV